jgi:WD40 repeat protein
MRDTATHCPNCGSAEVRYRRKRGDWVCDACEGHWAGARARDAEPSARTAVFLSYGRRDAADLANRLAIDLGAAGYDVWHDTRRIESGRSWEVQIEDGLRSAQLLVALLSPHAVRRAAENIDSVCLDEISFARFGKPPKPIVPVMAKLCEPPLSIFRLDYVDLCAWRDSEDAYRAGLERLLHAIGAALRGEPLRFRSWDERLRPWDFAAFLNEKRRGFCGREWLLREIDAWRTTSRDPALLVVGDPGVGKSALVAELVHRNPGGQVLAYHCCQADTPATLEPGRFVRSIAAMIASQVPEYAHAISSGEAAGALEEGRTAEDPRSAFEAGVLTPLEALPAPEGGARYLLVDALDEGLLATEHSVNIVDLLASRLGRLPGWLRVVATTRKEPSVLERLRGLRATEIDAHDTRNLDDVSAYIAARLAEPELAARLSESGRSAQWVVRTLSERSCGNFLYVRQALREVAQNHRGFAALEELPPGLGGLYGDFFRRRFPDGKGFKAARAVLEAMVAAREPLEGARLEEASGLEEHARFAKALRRLASFLPEREGRRRIFHRSLADWLLDEGRAAGPYGVDVQLGHERLARACWEGYRRGARGVSEYTRRHLVAHLIAARRWDDVERVLTDFGWVEAAARAGQVYGLAADYALATSTWNGEDASAESIWRRRLQAYAEALAAHAASGGAVPQPDAVESIPIIRQVDPHEPGGTELTALQRVEAWHNFLANNTDLLQSGERLPFELAYNCARSGPVADALSDLLRLGRGPGGPWFSLVNRPVYLPRPPCARTLGGHTNYVEAVAVTADGRRAVSGGWDTTVRVWDLETGAMLHTLEGHTDVVAGVAVTPDGATAASAGWDRALRVWNIEAGRSLGIIELPETRLNAVAIGPDGRIAVVGGADGACRVCDLETYAVRLVLEGHTGVVTSVAIVAGGRLALSASEDETVRVWDLDRGVCIRVLKGHTSEVLAVAGTPDGGRAVSGGEDRTLRVWDLASGECLVVIGLLESWVLAVAVTDDARYAATASDREVVRVWDLKDGRCVRRYEGHTNAVSSLAMLPDGRRLVSASLDRTVRLWDLESLVVPRSYARHEETVQDARSIGRWRAATAGDDKTVRLWDLATGDCVRTLDGHSEQVRAIAFVPGRDLLLSGGTEPSVRVWDAASGQCVARLEGHEYGIHALDVTPDGARAVSASEDRTLRVWDIGSFECLLTLKGHTRGVQSLALTPCGRFAVSASFDRSLRVWDLETGGEVAVMLGHRERIRVLRLTPDGRRALSGDYHGGLRVWDLTGGALLAELRGHREVVRGLALTPEGDRAVSSGFDLTVRVWDLTTGECTRVLEGHTKHVHGVDVTSDGRSAVSRAADGTMRLWDLETGRCLATYGSAGGPATAQCLAGSSLLIGTMSGQVDVLRLENLPGIETPRVVPTRLWLYGPDGAAGHWAEVLSVRCPECSRRSSVEAEKVGGQCTCAHEDCAAPIHLTRVVCDLSTTVRPSTSGPTREEL